MKVKNNKGAQCTHRYLSTFYVIRQICKKHDPLIAFSSVFIYLSFLRLEEMLLTESTSQLRRLQNLLLN